MGAQKRGLGALLLKDEKWTKMARCTFFEGRYFLGHPNTPRPISNDAGTVPAHCDLGFIGQLSKLTFRPTVNVHRVMYAKSAICLLSHATRALMNQSYVYHHYAYSVLKSYFIEILL